MRVGVIGLGIMGAPMARNLLRAGHEVVVHGRTAARVEPLVAAGARAAASPAAVASAVDAVVSSLPDDRTSSSWWGVAMACSRARRAASW